MFKIGDALLEDVVLEYFGLESYVVWTVDIMAVFVCTFASLAILAMVDIVYARTKQGRYYFLHVIANLGVTILVLPDTLFMLSSPIDALLQQQTSMAPFCIVLAIHMYHMLAPGFKLYYVDWLHHVLMIIIGLPPLLFARYGPLMNFNFLIVCGIPGGLDYAMLYLVKQGSMKSLAEKKYNTFLNVWCRGPFLISVVCMSFIQTHLLLERSAISNTVVFFRILCMVLNWWNGIYFTERVVANYYVTDFKLREARKTGDKTIYKIVDESQLRKPALVDGPEEHPLPSAPMLTRTARLDTISKAWEFVRAGS